MMNIKKKSVPRETVGEFIEKAFTDYAEANDVDLNFEEFCFVAEDDSEEIAGALTGITHYNEVHLGDLIIDKKYRRQGLGTKLVKTVEEEYGKKGFEKITLTTFGFQAPGFYKKLGYSLESAGQITPALSNGRWKKENRIIPTERDGEARERCMTTC